MARKLSLSLLIGHPCFPINKPTNGMKNCTGYKTEDVCHFEWLPGYKLIGSKARTCGANKQWTGNYSKCQSELSFQSCFRIFVQLAFLFFY